LRIDPAQLRASAIEARLIEWDEFDEGKRQKLTEASLTLAWSADGSLDITGKVTHPAYQANQSLGPDDLNSEDVLGHHAIAFP